jgi:hypothetical protein
VIANVLVMKDFLDRWPVTPLQKGIMSACTTQTMQKLPTQTGQSSGCP